MLALQEKKSQCVGETVRLVACNNFYTRHSFATAVHEITEGKIRLVGTVRMNYLGPENSVAVKKVVAELKDAPRGTWKLVRAYDPPMTAAEKRAAHAAARANKTSPVIVDVKTPADNAGYIMFKDSKVVIFYTNDLADTPTADVLDGDSEEAIRCCHGLATANRWCGNEVMYRTELQVPAIMAVYNKFMNAVDRMDQLRSSNPTRRREKRLPMTMFTGILDICINNAYALFRVICKFPQGQYLFHYV